MHAHNRILTYVLLATVAVTGLQCSDDDKDGMEIVEAATCYPTLLPVFEDLSVSVTYTDDHKVASATFAYDEEENEDDGFRAEYVYAADGKISRINYFQGSEPGNYVLFTYGTNLITESYYGDREGDGVHEKTSYYLYHLANDRVTSWGYHSTSRAPGSAALDSATFTYTNDNVTRIDGYDQNGNAAWYHTFEYDSKINPFYHSGLNGGGSDDGYFAEPTEFSKNNVTFWDSHSKNYTETIQYTYDDNSLLPLTKKVNDDAARPFEYDCQ